jgi:hypothetical protein
MIILPGRKVRERTGLAGHLLRSGDHAELCLDSQLVTTRGITVQRCDQSSRHQRFMFQYTAPPPPHN